MTSVTVYYFRRWDPRRGQNLVSRWPATRERIANLQGQLLEDTALQVDSSRLDSEGSLSYALRDRR
jgi:hypothetical protein